MKEIRRPTTIGEVGTMLHLAEFLLTQADRILLNIVVAPDCAAPEDVAKRAERMHTLVAEALEEVE